MVASLDDVRLLKEEDTGNCYCQSDDEIRIPDSRVITTKGESWLIETKNYFSKNPTRRYRIRNEDVQKLKQIHSARKPPSLFVPIAENCKTLGSHEWEADHDTYGPHRCCDRSCDHARWQGSFHSLTGWHDQGLESHRRTTDAHTTDSEIITAATSSVLVLTFDLIPIFGSNFDTFDNVIESFKPLEWLVEKVPNQGS